MYLIFTIIVIIIGFHTGKVIAEMITNKIKSEDFIKQFSPKRFINNN